LDKFYCNCCYSSKYLQHKVTKLPDLTKLKEHSEALRLAIVNVESFYKLYVDDDFPDLEAMIEIYTSKFKDISEQADGYIAEQKYQKFEKFDKKIIEIRLGLEREKAYGDYLMWKEKEAINMQMKGIRRGPEDKNTVPYDQHLTELDRAKKEALGIYESKQGHKFEVKYEKIMYLMKEEHEAQLLKIQNGAKNLMEENKLLKEQLRDSWSHDALPFIFKSNDTTDANSNSDDFEHNNKEQTKDASDNLKYFNYSESESDNIPYTLNEEPTIPSQSVSYKNRPKFSYSNLIDKFNEVTGQKLKKSRSSILRIDCRVPSHLEMLKLLSKIKVTGFKSFTLDYVPKDCKDVQNFIENMYFKELEKFKFNSSSDELVDIESYIPYFQRNQLHNQIKTIYFSNCYMSTQDVIDVLAVAKNVESGIGLVDSVLDTEEEFSFGDSLADATFKALHFTRSGKEDRSDFKNYPIILSNILNALGQVKEVKKNLEHIYFSECGISDKEMLASFAKNANLSGKIQIHL
jgi:hypothetical protein